MLSGQRIKTRKRDEREKYDPTGFRDAVIAGLEKTEGDLEQISKYLDSAGNKLDYRRYGEVLFDILIAGGLLGKFSAASNVFSLFTDPFPSSFQLQCLVVLYLRMAKSRAQATASSMRPRAWRACATMSRFVIF